MHVLELPTLLTVSICLAACNVGIMALGWNSNRNSTHFVMWSVSYVAILITMILLMGRSILPNFVSITLANGLGLAGYGAAWLGIRKFTGRLRKSDYAWTLSGSGLWFAVALTSDQFDSINFRTALISIVNIGFSLSLAHEIRAARSRERLLAYTPLIWQFTIHAICHVMRIALVITDPLPEGTDLLPQYGWYVWLALEATISMTFMGPTLLAIHGQRTEMKLRIAAETDALTGLCNRRVFMSRAKALAESSTGPGALILFDLDHFKVINDTHGHSIGDMALVAFADALAQRIEEPDVFARIGGEEFALYMPHATVGIATSFARHLRQCVRDISIPTGEGHIRLTVSCGIAAVAETGPNFELLLTAADTALYDAKHNGRDRAVVFSKAMKLKMFLGSTGVANLESMVI